MTQAEAQSTIESLNPGREEYAYTLKDERWPEPCVVGALQTRCGRGIDWESAVNDYSAKNASVVRLAAVKAFGRNDPCPCGSGKKFKKCCLN